MGVMAVCLATPVLAGGRVEILFNVPEGLGGYSGTQPVTFGVPFEAGALRRGDNVRVVDAAGRELPSQTEVTGTYGPDSDHVRWLLVDTVAAIEKGRAGRAFLEFGPDTPKPARFDAAVVLPVAVNALRFTLTDGEGKLYRAAGNLRESVERYGLVRGVVKLEGDYAAEDGSVAGQFVTRVRYYPGQPFVRVYHTLIWGRDASVRIADVSCRWEGEGEMKAAAGVDGKSVPLARGGRVTQRDWNAVSGAAQGRQLDGWIEARRGVGAEFLALRWPWQQFPTAFSADEKGVTVHLIGPETPMSLLPLDVAVPSVKLDVPSWNLRLFDAKDLWSVPYNGPAAMPHVSPRGVARTWELLLWRAEGKSPAPEVKNLLAQHPALACADPAFAVRAEVPNPASAYDPKAFPEAEAALQRAFRWYTLDRAEDGDYGTWNYGDIQWNWLGSAYTIYRYWMNNGKGWSVLPWALWIRSGDRRYWENGEANSRHVMDVDTCHVPEWSYAPDGKIRGGQYHYSALHWGYGPHVSQFFSDSEYLPYCWFMTGYERARDVMLERVEALARDNWQARVKYFTENKADRSRHLYAMLKDLAILYESTWDKRLLPYAEAYLALTLDAQNATGGFPGVKTNHYLDEALLVAGRVFGMEKVLPVLKKWEDAQGDSVRPGAGAANSGPMSLWTLVAVARATGDRSYLRTAAEVMNSQAAAVGAEAGEWTGISYIPGHEAGPALRDWPAVMGELARLPASERPAELFPVVYFEALLSVPPEREKEGWKERHLVLVLDERDEAFTARFCFLFHNAGTARPARVRVFAPDGALVSDATRDYAPMESGTPAFAALTASVPRDGKKGVYVFEVSHQSIRCSLHATSTTGRVVHYVPGPQLALNAAPYAGQAWFEPAGKAPVSFGFPAGVVIGRMSVRGPDGREVAASRVTGSAPGRKPGMVSFPAAEGIKFDPAAPGLHQFVGAMTTKPGNVMAVGGVKPWFSCRREWWFDAAQYPVPDLKEILSR
jgi:hypothetical protein